LAESLERQAKTNPDLQDVVRIMRTHKVSSIVRVHTLGSEPAHIEAPEDQHLRLDTELFYYVAHRFCRLLRMLPGVELFECRGVMIVRNQLLEHPEGKGSGVLFPSFAYSADTGPVVKGFRLEPQSATHPDRGFLANTEELINSATTALNAAAGRVAPA
jgi:hypothetical protein